jgi:hypothetical protein
MMMMMVVGIQCREMFPLTNFWEGGMPEVKAFPGREHMV